MTEWFGYESYESQDESSLEEDNIMVPPPLPVRPALSSVWEEVFVMEDIATKSG